MSEVDGIEACRTLQARLRTTLGWSVGDHTAIYILDRLGAGASRGFAVFVSDARTGRPLHAEFDPACVGAAGQPAQMSLF